MRKFLLAILIACAGVSAQADQTAYPTATSAFTGFTVVGIAQAWDAINDSIGAPDDNTTYIKRTNTDAVGGSAAFTLNTIYNPSNTSGWSFSFRARLEVAESVILDRDGALVRVKLRNLGNTVTYATRDFHVSAAGFADFSFNLTSGEASSISYTSGVANLRLEFSSGNYNTGLTSASVLRITQAYLTAPDVPALAITTSSPLTSGTVGIAYSQTFARSGGVAPFAWTITTAGVPPDVSMNSSAGIMSGTPTQADNWTFNVRVTGANGAQANKSFTWYVWSSVTVTNGSFGPFYVGTAASQPITYGGGRAPVHATLDAGTLPPGLSVVESPVGSNAISGTPTTAGSYSFTIRVTDDEGRTATKAFSGVQVVEALTVTTTSLPAGTAYQSYSANLQYGGGLAPVHFSVVSGSLPPGLSITESPVGVSHVTGLPTTPGDYSFTVRATDDGSHTADKALSIHIGSGSLPSQGDAWIALRAQMIQQAEDAEGLLQRVGSGTLAASVTFAVIAFMGVFHALRGGF